MAYKITVPPTSEPVTLTEAKAWLKIHPDVNEDDALIKGLIASARIWAEKQTGRALLAQTIQEVWDWPNCRVFDLSIGPLIAVESFEYRNASGAYTTWANTNYTVDDVSEPGRVVVKGNSPLPYFSLPADVYPNLIRITYTAGETEAANVDANIKTAMLLQIGLMYENREDMPLGKDGSPTARSAWNLLALSRLNWL